MKGRSGWKGESRRHSLARKGIRTAKGNIHKNLKGKPYQRLYGSFKGIEKIIENKKDRGQVMTIYHDGKPYEHQIWIWEILPSLYKYDDFNKSKIEKMITIEKHFGIDISNKDEGDIWDELYDEIRKHEIWLNKNVHPDVFPYGDIQIWNIDPEDPDSAVYLMYVWKEKG